MNQTLCGNISVVFKEELAWFEKVLETRIKLYFNHDCQEKSIYENSPPNLKVNFFYDQFINQNSVSFNERVMIMLALMPHIKPQCLDIFFSVNEVTGRPYTEFGGWAGDGHGGFIPTVETLLFILCGSDIEKRMEVMSYFIEGGLLVQNSILEVIYKNENEPIASGGLFISNEYLNLFLYNLPESINFSSSFPAKKITTLLTEEDLVLDQEAANEVNQLILWVKNEHIIMDEWGFRKYLKNGFRSLFYGPSGTGKTLTACIIGKKLGVDVYRIDLSMIVSKYIGETEKNLARIFDKAENKNWILFFDEADALFGQRTQAQTSNDRRANQEVAYLLQRIEEYNGIVILATNLLGNIDDAFARRFQSSIYFSMPEADLRLMLWENMLKSSKVCSKSLDLNYLAEKYEISGGSMINALRSAAITALEKSSGVIEMEDLIFGVRKELIKNGKIL